MEQIDALSPVRELIAFLRRHTLRTRVGVWCMPLSYIGQEHDVAALLNLEAVDVRQPVLDALPVGTRYVNLTFEKVLEALDSIASRAGQTDCAFVYNLDLLLAGLTRDDRQRVWESLGDGLPYRTRALLLAMPETASRMLPPDRLYEAWRLNGRLV